MLTLFADGAESLWDELLPEEVRCCDDLARWTSCSRSRAAGADRAALGAGARGGQRFSDRERPSLAMETYVRLMVLKHVRLGMRDVDARGLRLDPSAALLPLGLTEQGRTSRRCGSRPGGWARRWCTSHARADWKARREKRFRPRAARIDSTVVEANIAVRPTRAGGRRVKALAREGRKLAAKIGAKRTAVRDRSRAAGRRLRALTRSIRRRSGEAQEEVLELTKQTGRPLARRSRSAAAGRRGQASGARARRRAELKAARKLDELADRCEKVVEQITKRLKGEKITDRLISLWTRTPADPQGQALTAQPVRLRRSAVRDHRQRRAGCARVILPPSARSATRARRRCCRPPRPSWRTLTSSCGR